MVQWAIKNFGGEIPRADPRLLPDPAAEQAWNCDLAAGTVAGLKTPFVVKDLTGASGTVRRAYRLPAPDIGDPDAWLPLPSEFSSVVKSPLANDTTHRVYWTNPGEGAFWATYAMLIAEDDPYTLGFIAPDATYQPVVTATGGTDPDVVPYVARSYLVTFINAFGEESSPSLPSDVVSGASDGEWKIVMPVVLPGQPVGKNYPLPTKMRLYRTVTGQSTGAAFYEVTTFDMGADPPPGTGYIDTTDDTAIVSGTQLESASWVNPPDDLDGLIGMTGGMLIGFSENTLHFCEPNRPHAWPAGYDQSVLFRIVGLAVWQQSLMIMTQGFPSQGSGTTPAAFTLTQIQVPEPCIARGSIMTDLLGCYYASQNGLVILNYYGAENKTVGMLTNQQWLTDYKASSIIGCRHRSQYLALIDTGLGFLIDYAEDRLGIVHINTFANAVCVWNDIYTGDTYIIADKIVYRWDKPLEPPLTYRWRSKRFYLAKPANIGAVQLHMDPSILTATAPVDPPPLDNPDARLDLPDDVNCTFKLYADDVLKYTRNILLETDIFGPPSGYLAFTYQIEIVSRVPFISVELASTMKELKGA